MTGPSQERHAWCDFSTKRHEGQWIRRRDWPQDGACQKEREPDLAATRDTLEHQLVSLPGGVQPRRNEFWGEANCGDGADGLI